MKQFETFGEYMFDLLFAPLKKGRKTVNQLRIFFKVMGREFDDLKAAIFRVRSEANVASCSEVMLPVHGQDRDMPRLEGEDAEAYERGVEDFTYACGTGTGSVVTVLTLLGKVSGKHVRVDMTGGTLYVDVERNAAGRVTDLYLTGPTNVVCKGEITDENLVL